VALRSRSRRRKGPQGRAKTDGSCAWPFPLRFDQPRLRRPIPGVATRAGDPPAAAFTNVPWPPWLTWLRAWQANTTPSRGNHRCSSGFSRDALLADRDW